MHLIFACSSLCYSTFTAVTINLKPTVYKVNESDGEVDIFAEVEIEDNDCPIEPAFDLSVSITRDGGIVVVAVVYKAIILHLITADDSDGIEIFLPFVSCENRGYVTLPIINDDVLEHKLENFTVTLAQSEELAANVHLGPKIIIGDRVGKISIEDDEPGEGLRYCLRLHCKFFLFLRCYCESPGTFHDCVCGGSQGYECLYNYYW